MLIKKRDILAMLILSIVYLAWFYLVVELRMEHVLILIGIIIAYLLNGKPRKFLYAVIPMLIFLTAYDSLRAFPNYLYNDVSIAEIYEIEKSLFGITVDGQILTPNEFFLNHEHISLYLLAGVAYLTWIPVPLAFALFLYFSGRKEDYLNLTLLFVLTNLLGFIGYYLYPAAPPWYVEMYGFEFLDNIKGEAARLSNFDNYVGYAIFEGIYNKNANVFAAVPSIHAANPFVCFLASLQMKNLWLKVGLFLLTCAMWFGAVYSNHHYLVDVLCGALVAGVAYIIIYRLIRNTSFNKYLVKFEEKI